MKLVQLLFLLLILVSSLVVSKDDSLPSRESIVKRLQQVYNNPQHKNDVSNSFFSFSDASQVGVSAAALIFSSKAHLCDKSMLLEKSISHFIDQLRQQAAASSILDKAQELKNLLWSKDTILSSPNVRMITKYAVVVAASANTLKTLYDVYNFESVFELVGEQVHEMRTILFTEVKPRLGIMMQALKAMMGHIDDHDIFNATSLTTETYFDHLNLVFDKNYKETNQQLQALQYKIELLANQTQGEKIFFENKKGTSVRTALASLGYLALSASVGVLFPPALPYIGATKLSVLVGSLVASVNTGLAYISHHNQEKAMYRLKQLADLGKDIDLVKQEVNLFHQQFELVRQQYNREQQQRLLELSRQWRIFKFCSTIVQSTYTWISHSFFKLLLWSTVTLIVSAAFLHARRNWESLILQPSKMIPLFVGLLISLILVSIVVDSMEGIYMTKFNHSEYRKQQTCTHKKILAQRYQHECIWYEIPLSRQFTLHLKALFWTILGQDGFRAITANATGHLVNDPTCLTYLEKMENDNHDNAAERVGAVYGDFASGFVHPIVDMITQASEAVVQKTSLITKIWILGVSMLFFVLMAKRIIFCC